MAVAKKKTDVGELVKPLPKFGEVGYKFLVEAEITQDDYEQDNYDSEYPYMVTVTLGIDHDPETAEKAFNKEELVAFISKTNPKFKKGYITQQLKDAKALVVSLEKQLAAN